jgi:hypothetical protein
VHLRVAGVVLLLALRRVVGIAVEFDGELCLEAIEVGGVRPSGR